MNDRPILLFDVMDTLVYNPFPREIAEFFGLSHEELVQQSNPTVWIEFELGRIEEAEYQRRLFSDGRAFDTDAFQRCVRDAYRWLDGMEELLSRLRGRSLEIHAFSNYPVWYQTVESQLGLSRYMDWSFVSCRTNVRKPDADAYLRAVDALDSHPRACLLIDDSAANCQGAKSVGMRAIRFVDAPGLWGELRRRELV